MKLGNNLIKKLTPTGGRNTNFEKHILEILIKRT